MNLEILESVDLKNHNTLGIGGKAAYFFLPKNIDELVFGLNKFKVERRKTFIIGGGSNILLPDDDFSGVIISLKNMNSIKIINSEALVEAGVFLGFMNNILLKNGFVNFTWASGIPGTLGGALYINAGAYNHDIYEDLISVTYIKNDKVITKLKKDILFGYRKTNFTNEVIVSAKFALKVGDTKIAKEQMLELSQKRMIAQPLNEKNAGSTFKNPNNFYAGKLIEDNNLKSFSIGGAKISDKHANFIVNFNNAKSSDIINLINHVKTVVKENNDIDLELENKIINWK